MKRTLISLTIAGLTLASDDTSPAFVNDGLQIYKDATQRGGSIFSDVKKAFVDIFSNDQDDDFNIQNPITSLGDSVNIFRDNTKGWDDLVLKKNSGLKLFSAKKALKGGKKAVKKTIKDGKKVAKYAIDHQAQIEQGIDIGVKIYEEARDNQLIAKNKTRVVAQSAGVDIFGDITHGKDHAHTKLWEKKENDDEELFSVKKVVEQGKKLAQDALDHKQEIEKAVAMESQIVETLNDDELLRKLKQLIGFHGKDGNESSDSSDDTDDQNNAFLAF